MAFDVYPFPEEEKDKVLQRRRRQGRVQAGLVELFGGSIDVTSLLCDRAFNLRPGWRRDTQLGAYPGAAQCVSQVRQRRFWTVAPRVHYGQHLLTVEPRTMVRIGEPGDEIFHEPADV